MIPKEFKQLPEKLSCIRLNVFCDSISNHDNQWAAREAMRMEVPNVLLGMPWGSCPRKKQILFESKHKTNKNWKKNSAVNPKEKAIMDLFLQTSWTCLVPTNVHTNHICAPSKCSVSCVTNACPHHWDNLEPLSSLKYISMFIYSRRLEKLLFIFPTCIVGM